MTILFATVGKVKQEMSRNKTIKFYHDVTNLSYSVCRANLKKHHWDVREALGYSDITDKVASLSDAMENLSEGLREVFLNTFDFIGDFFINYGKNLKSVVENLRTTDYDLGYTTERGETNDRGNSKEENSAEVH